MKYKKWCEPTTGEFWNTHEECEKCEEAPCRHRYHFGYVQVVPGVRYKRYWHLCSECHGNAKIKNQNRQHPLWQVVTLKDENGKDKGIKLKRTDKLIWPDDEKGKGYNTSLKHPSLARNAIDNS